MMPFTASTSTLPLIGFDGYKITGFHHSSDVLGGDIYYFLNGSETQTGFLIADISGHGVQAAQVMSVAVESFNKHSLGAQSAAAILCAVNADLHEHICGGRFITAFLGILEHSSGKLRFVQKHAKNELSVVVFLCVLRAFA